MRMSVFVTELYISTPFSVRITRIDSRCLYTVQSDSDSIDKQYDINTFFQLCNYSSYS